MSISGADQSWMPIQSAFYDGSVLLIETHHTATMLHLQTAAGLQELSPNAEKTILTLQEPPLSVQAGTGPLFEIHKTGKQHDLL